jgi:invasion protein IalB
MLRPLVLAAAMLIGATGSTLAQEPQSTTATYDDWVVRCAMHDAAKVCQMTQSTQLKGQSQPVTQIAIGRQVKNGALKIAFQVPISVWLASGVTLTADDGHGLVAAHFNRCIPAGCIAETDIEKTVIAKMRRLKKNGTLHFKNVNQQDVAAPVSFKGFGDAFDALPK